MAGRDGFSRMLSIKGHTVDIYIYIYTKYWCVDEQYWHEGSAIHFLPSKKVQCEEIKCWNLF